jgi:nucleotide-binding universal stress UspA family protein
MILFCYDGSPDAQAAIDHGAGLMPGAEATVLTIWQPFVDSTAYSGAMGLSVDYAGAADAARADSIGQELAHDTATEGAQRAGEAGLAARWRVAGRYGAMSSMILDVAAEVDADVIVCGTRGRSGVKSFLLGSVSHDVVQHADRPVLVVPSSALAEKRRRPATSDDAGRVAVAQGAG